MVRDPRHEVKTTNVMVSRRITGTSSAHRAVMSSLTRSQSVTRARVRRRARGVTLLEYVVLVSFVVVPCIVATVACFVQLALWYTRFVDTVSLPTP